MSPTPKGTRRPRSARSNRDPDLNGGDLVEEVEPAPASPTPAPAALHPRVEPARAPMSLAPSVFELLLIVLIGLIFAAAGAAVVHLQHATYVSTAQLQIDDPIQIALSADEGVVAKLSGLRLKYVGLATSTLIQGPTAAKLNVPRNVVHAAISAVAPLDSLLLEVDARTGSPVDSQKIAQATAEQIILFTQEDQIKNRIPPEGRYEFILINEASPGVKVAPTRHREVVVSVIAGVLAMAAAYVLLKLRSTARSPG